jgi:hypothetical protein
MSLTYIHYYFTFNESWILLSITLFSPYFPIYVWLCTNIFLNVSYELYFYRSEHSRNELWTIPVPCTSRSHRPGYIITEQKLFLNHHPVFEAQIRAVCVFTQNEHTQRHDAAGYQCSSLINYLQRQLFRITLLIRCRYFVPFGLHHVGSTRMTWHTMQGQLSLSINLFVQ